MLTSGISAEYGRFSGGVINMVTKSGGNTFSGSVRLNFTQPGLVQRVAAREVTQPDESRYAVEVSRRHVRRAGRARPRCGSSSPGGASARAAEQLDRADADAVRTDDQQRPLRDQGDRHAGRTTTPSRAASSTTRPSSGPREPQRRAVARHDRARRRARQPNRLFVTNYNGVLGSRVFVDRPVLAEGVRLPQRGWHEHGARRLAVPRPRRRRGHDQRPALSRAVLLGARSGGSRTTGSIAGSVSYFLTTA